MTTDKHNKALRTNILKDDNDTGTNGRNLNFDFLDRTDGRTDARTNLIFVQLFVLFFIIWT